MARHILELLLMLVVPYHRSAGLLRAIGLDHHRLHVPSERAHAGPTLRVGT